MRRRRSGCDPRHFRHGLLVAFCLVALGACTQTPTEITPLPRAIGEVAAVLLQVTSLAPLQADTEGVYYLWSLQERNQSAPLGSFFVDAGGQIVDENGVPKREFTADDFSIRKTLGLLITIEQPGAAPSNPTGMQILSGTFIEGVADLTVPISSAIREASGSLRVFTPTDGVDNNESSGVWMQQADGSPSLTIPDTSAALLYETFIDVGAQFLPVGRFDTADEADTVNQFSEELFPAPDRPGEDLLRNAPEGLVFPIDLSGARVTISLEGRGASDFARQSQLIVLEVILPGGLIGGEQIHFVNRTVSFPTGKAVLY